MDKEENAAVNTGAANVDTLHLPELANKKLQAGVLRLDKIHPVISGNKWFKLRYHLQHALHNKHTAIVTFGGAYSNHILATACACMQMAFQSVGIIRGEKPAQLSYTLKTAEAYGMQLLFVSREAYANKQESEPVQTLLYRYNNPYIIPEGGSGEEGIRGCREIMELADFSSYTHIMCCIGTGTMFTGLSQSLAAGQQLIGIPVLKLDAGSSLIQSLGISLRRHNVNDFCQILLPYHFGGYAKKTPELLGFMNDFYAHTGIPTDFVYTGKLLFALLDLAEKDYFPEQSNILVIHSGGLQGNTSLPAQKLVY